MEPQSQAFPMVMVVEAFQMVVEVLAVEVLAVEELAVEVLALWVITRVFAEPDTVTVSILPHAAANDVRIRPPFLAHLVNCFMQPVDVMVKQDRGRLKGVAASAAE